MFIKKIKAGFLFINNFFFFDSNINYNMFSNKLASKEDEIEMQLNISNTIAFYDQKLNEFKLFNLFHDKEVFYTIPNKLRPTQ